MIYLNNAATTYPKPQCVLEAHTAFLYKLPFSQFRSSNSLETEDIFSSCRNKLGDLLQIKNTERIFFSSGATDSLNAVICGLNLSGRKIITTQTEHNSVLRPLFNFYKQKDREDKVIIVPCDSNGKVEPSDIESAITDDVGTVFVNHCSNVTGMVQDIEKIGKITKKHNLTFVVDASQSAGCIPIKTDEWGIDVLIFTGHKSLFGVQGTGGYYLKEGIEMSPFRYGGTGKNSLKLSYENGDYEYEVGTQNTPGITVLNAGVDYILKRGLANIVKKESILIQMIYNSFNEMPNVKVYGNVLINHGPVISFNILGLKPSDVAFVLQNGYDIIVRTGIHCAPLIHEKLGTKDFGTVRVSISDLTKVKEVEQLVDAVFSIQNSVGDR